MKLNSIEKIKKELIKIVTEPFYFFCSSEDKSVAQQEIIYFVCRMRALFAAKESLLFN